jgi:hypothetical protein
MNLQNVVMLSLRNYDNDKDKLFKNENVRYCLLYGNTLLYKNIQIVGIRVPSRKPDKTYIFAKNELLYSVQGQFFTTFLL